MTTHHESKMKDVRARWRMLGPVARLAVAAACLSACALEVADPNELQSGDEPEVAVQAAPLSHQGDLYSGKNIAVCFDRSGYSDVKRWIQATLRGQRSWADQGNVTFTGFGTCGSNPKGIRFREGPAKGSLGPGGDGLADITIEFALFRSRGETSTRNQYVVLHEVGHALGYEHEQKRDDPPAAYASKECADAQGQAVGTSYGDWDVPSIMNYCSDSENLSSMDRVGHNRVYGFKRGGSPRANDYNGDGRDDLLCHDVMNGDKEIDFAGHGGTLTGVEWSRAANWCAHRTGVLHGGDFNGDGRADLLCHDNSSGKKWIDYANSFGQFYGTDWSREDGWCSHATAQLSMGDFNGDGRTDLLCHDVRDGRKWVDLANDRGQFYGTDWSRNSSWCTGSRRRLLVDDYNGDGRDDLLCHDLLDGRRWIDYADASGRFNGTDWSTSARWCAHEEAELFTGDFDGDGRADLLCHDAVRGTKWIDYANSRGEFYGSNWSWGTNWCRHANARLKVGDFDGDGRDDWNCHDVQSGTKWFLYADSNGRFSTANQWVVNDGWCEHAAGVLF